MISKFFTTSISVSRQEWTGNTSALATKGTFKGHIQQATPDVMQQYQGLRHTKAWIVWCAADTDVQEGDRLTADNVDYDVRFVEDRNVGNEGHLQIVAEKAETGS